MSDRVGEAITYFENSTHRITYLSVRVFYIAQSSRVEILHPVNSCIEIFIPYCAATVLVGLTWSEQLLWVWLAQSWADVRAPVPLLFGNPEKAAPALKRASREFPANPTTASWPRWVCQQRPPPHTSSAPVTSHSLLTSALSPDSWTPRLTRLCCHS